MCAPHLSVSGRRVLVRHPDGPDAFFMSLSASWLTLPGLIYFQGTAIKFLSIQAFDSGIGIGIVIHFDEAKTPESPGVPISNQIDRSHRAVFFKQLFDRGFCGAEGQVSNIDVLHVVLFLLLKGFQTAIQHQLCSL